MKASKTYLKLLIVVGLVAVVGGTAGTFASFNAETTNAGNVFQTGTLVLSNDGPGTLCLSTGAGTSTDTNTNAACDALFPADVNAPGDIAVADVTLKNEGSLPASTLSLTKSACTDDDAAGETYHGTGSVCGALNFYVQEWDSATHDNAVKCWYGGTSSANTCDTTFASSPVTLAAFGTTAVDISDPAGGSADAFAANGDTGDTRYFTVALQLPDSGVQNTLQGRTATFDLSWKESQ
jgi:predicted ribosomally synthesized peptide with SipW-like signal peptide